MAQRGIKIFWNKKATEDVQGTNILIYLIVIGIFLAILIVIIKSIYQKTLT